MKQAPMGRVVSIGYGKANGEGLEGASNERLLWRLQESRLRKRKCRRGGSRGRFSYGCPRNEGALPCHVGGPRAPGPGECIDQAHHQVRWPSAASGIRTKACVLYGRRRWPNLRR